MNSTPEPDPALIEARDLALAALKDITPDATIGAPAGYRLEEDGVVSLRFENRLGGYPGWYWTVSLARVEGEEPTVLEVELLPGDGALLAPDWVPWAERLADYQAAQAAQAEAGDEADTEADAGEFDDVDDMDEGDFDADGSPILHAGDVDGVDIDELADDAESDDDDEESDDDDEESDDDDEESDDDDDESDDDDDESDDDDDSGGDDDESDDDFDEDDSDDSDEDDSDD
jgi:hypothetical protein